MTRAYSSEVPERSTLGRKPERDSPDSWTQRKSKLEKATSKEVNIILIGFALKRRTTFIFGPTQSEVSTKRYEPSKKRRRKHKGDAWTNGGPTRQQGG